MRPGSWKAPFRGAQTVHSSPNEKQQFEALDVEETSCFDLSTAQQTPQLHTTAVLMCWGHSPSPPLQGDRGEDP